MQGLDWLKQGAWSVLLCIAAGLFFLGGAEAAVTWEKAYYTSPTGVVTAPTADGGYVSLGFFNDSGDYLPTVMKLDTLGNIEWYRRYRPAVGRWDIVAKITPTKDGGFLLCGLSYVPTSGALVMKLDGLGNVLWTKTYLPALPPKYSGSPYYKRSDNGIQILEADDGGYLFLAADQIGTMARTAEKNLWLLKLSSGGDIQWQKSLAASAGDWAENLLKTRAGDYMVTAHTNLGTGGSSRSLVLKVDALGTIKWAKTYDNARTNLLHSLTEFEDGSFALAGKELILRMPWVVKFDPSGDIVWQKEYITAQKVDHALTILPAADNGLLVAGGYASSAILKLSSAGTAQWLAELKNGGIVRSFQPTTDGGYVLSSWGNTVFKLDANAEGCRPYLKKTYLTTTIDNNFIAADASINTVLTDAVPVSIAVESEDLSSPTSYLYCISALPEIAVDASALDYGFGSVEVLTSEAAKVFVSNSCGADLHVSAMTITGANAGDFTLSTDCSAVAAGGSCTAEIVFAPGSLGVKLALLTITSDDPKQPKIEIPLSGQAVDTVAPVITLLGQEELTVEAGSVYVDAGATALDNYDGNLTTAIATDNPVNSTVVGTYLVTYDVADASGNRATQLLRTVHVVDTIPPEVSLSVDRSLLWPPNHKLIDILVNGGAQDSGSGLLSVVLSITDEYGKYNLTLPAFGSTVALEAWRDGLDKDGRIYTLTAVATDRAGNTTTRSSNILVPHDMGK